MESKTTEYNYDEGMNDYHLTKELLLANTSIFARLLKAYKAATPAVQKQVDFHITSLNDDKMTEDEKMRASAAIMEALYPMSVKVYRFNSK